MIGNLDQRRNRNLLHITGAYIFKSEDQSLDQLFDVIWKINDAIKMPMLNPKYTYMEQKPIIKELNKKIQKIHQYKSDFFYFLKCVYILQKKSLVADYLHHTIYEPYQLSNPFMCIPQFSKIVKIQHFRKSITNKKLKRIHDQIHKHDYKQQFGQIEQDELDTYKSYYYTYLYKESRPTYDVLQMLYSKINKTVQKMIKTTQQIMSLKEFYHQKVIQWSSKILILNYYLQQMDMTDNEEDQFQYIKCTYPTINNIAHISFINLTTLSLKGWYLESIEAISWLNCFTLQKLELSKHSITSLKPLKKTNFYQLQSFILQNTIDNYSQLQQGNQCDCINPNSDQFKSLSRMRFTSNKPINILLYQYSERNEDDCNQTPIYNPFYFKFYSIDWEQQSSFINHPHRYATLYFQMRLHKKAFYRKNNMIQQEEESQITSREFYRRGFKRRQNQRKSLLSRCQSQTEFKRIPNIADRIDEVRDVIQQRIGWQQERRMYAYLNDDEMDKQEVQMQSNNINNENLQELQQKSIIHENQQYASRSLDEQFNKNELSNRIEECSHIHQNNLNNHPNTNLKDQQDLLINTYEQIIQNIFKINKKNNKRSLSLDKIKQKPNHLRSRSRMFIIL